MPNSSGHRNEPRKVSQEIARERIRQHEIEMHGPGETEHPHSLDDLSDVEASSPLHGQVLTYIQEEFGGNWRPQYPFSIPDPGGSGEGGPWAATRIVAASDSAHPESADYVCDGTDDQEEINNAILDLPITGGRVLLLEGTFNITNSIQMVRWNTTLQGQGAGADNLHNLGPDPGVTGATRLKIPDDTNTAFAVISDGVRTAQMNVRSTSTTGSYNAGLPDPKGTSRQRRGGLSIRDLLIDGNGRNQTLSGSVWNHGIDMYDIWGVTVQNVAIVRCGGCGVSLWGLNLRVQDNFFWENYMHGMVLQGLSTGCLVFRNYVKGSGEDYWDADVFGAPYGAGIVCSDSNILIGDNWVHDSSGDGIFIRDLGTQGHIIRNMLQSNCITVESESQVDDYAGIHVTSPTSSSYLTILGNTIWDAFGMGIRVKNVQKPLVDANLLQSIGGHGIEVFDCEYPKVSNNIVEEAGGGKDTSPVFDGIHIGGSVETLQAYVSGNYVRLGTVSVTRYGLRVDTASTDAWVIGNDLRESGVTANFSDAGSGTDTTTFGNKTS